MAAVLTVSSVSAVTFGIIYKNTGNEASLTLSITFMTVAYHFFMRLAVGEAVTVIYRNREFNVNGFFLRTRSFEEPLYEKLGVKKLKKTALTAKPEQFKVKRDELLTLIHNMCQAEVGHAIMIPLSFLPLLLIIPFGAPVVFLLTSTAAALVDLKYTVIQRYNLPRAERLLEAVRRREIRFAEKGTE